MRSRLAVLIGLGIGVRLLALLGPGHYGDEVALDSWANGMATHGLGYYASGGDANYPAVLWLLWPLGAAFHGATLTLAIRALSVPFDIGVGLAIFRIAGIGPAALYLLNPAVLIAGPFWGQVDVVGALPMLLSIRAAGARRYPAAIALGVIAALVKPQFGVALAVAAVMLAKERRWDRLLRSAGAGLVTAAAIMLPLGVTPWRYFAMIAGSADRYPYASLFAFNPWALLGFETPDAGVAIYGALALGLACVLVAVMLWRDPYPTTTDLLRAGALLALAVYFLPTRVHDRYLFGVIVLMAPLAVGRARAPFVALSTAFAAALAWTLSLLPYRPPVPHVGLTPEMIGAAAVAMTVIGAWSALELAPSARRAAAAVHRKVLRGAGLRPSGSPALLV